MANSYTKIHETETGYAVHTNSHDTFATVAKDLDIGPTTLISMVISVGSGSDYLVMWDDENPTAGTTAPDYQFPTTANCPVHVLSGMAFSNGLTCTVADVGGTVCSTDPGAANTVILVTEPT